MKKKERPKLNLDDSFSSISELKPWLLFIKENFKFYGKPKHEEKWLDVPCSFDIEATSFRNEKGEKCATMYIWMVSIFGKAFYGRTWFEFYSFLNECVEILELNVNRRMIFFVHNLSFEMGFTENLFDWANIFATDYHKVIYAYDQRGIEFRCSLFLYGASLEYLGENGLHEYQVKKAVGQLDYKKPRHYKTPLTPEEMNYCLEDVQVVVAYIEELIHQEKRISRIPLTKTGFPRRLVKNNMLHSKGCYDTRKQIENITFELDEFLLLRWSFMGGFTHSAHLKVGKVWYDVASQDFTSSYPYCLLLPLYPISKGEKVTIKDDKHFRRCMKNYCCLMHIRLYNVKEKFTYEHILSQSKCKNLVNPVVDNGRIVSCDSCEIAINEIDFEMLEKFYNFDYEVIELWRYHRGYLPKEFILTVIDLFWQKQTYKYDEEMQMEFMLAKGNLNSLYGVAVTNPIRNEITFSKEKGWSKTGVNFAEALEKYNNKKSRFTSYAWGCWCTSIGRMNLQNAILELGNDYIYSDTDSVKYLNKEKHDDMFSAYNEGVEKNLHAMCDFYRIPLERVSPNGNMIGVFDYEGKKKGNYRRFKTLGAKRYLVQYHRTGKVEMTVAGLNKKTAMPWMEINYDDPFEAFNDSLHVPEGFAGKLTHTYCDEGFTDFLTDYLGETVAVSEASFVHLEETSYSLSIADEFKQYLERFTL